MKLMKQKNNFFLLCEHIAPTSFLYIYTTLVKEAAPDHHQLTGLRDDFGLPAPSKQLQCRAPYPQKPACGSPKNSGSQSPVYKSYKRRTVEVAWNKHNHKSNRVESSSKCRTVNVVRTIPPSLPPLPPSRRVYLKQSSEEVDTEGDRATPPRSGDSPKNSRRTRRSRGGERYSVRP